jgi:hypothetical protein
MARTHSRHNLQSIHQYIQPTFNPGLTWGLGNRAAYVPGPGGPLVDNRRFVKQVAPGNPVFGRVGALSCMRTFGPNFGVWSPWQPVAPWNNAWAGVIIQQYVPGWYKPPPTPASGF